MGKRSWRIGALSALALVTACTSVGSPATRAESAPSAAAAAATMASAKPFIPVGRFVLTPAHARPGATVTASASGLTAGSRYDLAWGAIDGAWKLSDDRALIRGRRFSERKETLGSATADAAGAFSTTFVVPAGFGYTHDVTVVSGTDVVNKSGFDVDMDLKVSPASGAPGTPIALELSGIGYRALQNSWLVLYDNAFTGWLSGVTTQGTARATIPAVGRPGTHIITVIHGGYGAAYLNPQDSPQPDRPTWRIPFTVTAGSPVLPTPVDTQTIPDTTIKLPQDHGLSFEPARGIVGSRTTVRAAGLQPNTDVALVWLNAGGVDAVAGTRPDTEEPVGSARTDASGAFSWDFTVPDEAGGAHTLVARIAGKTVATTVYAIQPSVQPLSVTRGPSGTQFVIQMNGIYTTDTGKIYHLVYDNAFSGYMCSFNTGGNVKVVFRASGDVGWHFIDLYPGLYDGDEKLPNNYKMPQLTAANDHPGEVMPIFHLAFEVTAP